MEEKPNVPHRVTLTPAVFDQLLSYIRYFINDQQSKLETLQRNRDPYRVQTREIQETIATIQIEIQRAETTFNHIETAKRKLFHIYKWNFDQIAAVFKEIRIQLHLDDILSMYSLKVCVICVMHMLKSDNPFFSKDKFIKKINERN